ncbi:MAG: serine hydrolase domain-containing protein [Nannocystaceae bacterium]
MLGLWMLLLTLGQLDASTMPDTAGDCVTQQQRTSPAPARFAEVAKLLDDGVRTKAFPGAVVVVGSRTGIEWTHATGYQTYAKKTPVDAHTLYDLASLTKVVGTTMVLMSLVAADLVSVDDTVGQHVPAFIHGDRKQRRWRQRVTLGDLLTHRSGLPDWAPLYRGKPGYSHVVARALKVPLKRRPGRKTVYSDIGFIILGEVIQQVTQDSLARVESNRVFQPMHMQDTLRAPPASLVPNIAPTELQNGRAIHGEVHDRNARAGEGQTGHAGLFSCAHDLAKLAQALLKSRHGEPTPLPQTQVLAFTTRQSPQPRASFGLGWDTPSGEHSSFGSEVSPQLFGHHGFTGTTLWVDPKNDLFVVLLTNRVHPTRDNNQLRKLRPKLADAIVRATAATP